MSRTIFFTLMCVLVVGLAAALCQAGVGPSDSTASFWAIVAIADAMGLVGFLWGRDEC